MISHLLDQLLGVDALVEIQAYKKALVKLEDLLGQDLPREMVEVLRKTIDEVVIMAAREKEDQRLRAVQMLEERWQEADHLFDSEQFDDAIVVFSSLFGTSYDVEARVKIGDAAALAAAKLRREGAALFFKAGQTTDAEEKKELLLQSQQLLQIILDRYPYVNLVDKVVRNLQIIDEQLRVVDPFAGYGVSGEQDAATGQQGADGDNGSFPW